MSDPYNLLAVILGGGRGERLFPLTRDRAKPAVPIGGKYRLIDIPISNCINSGIKQIRLLTQFNTTSLHRHIFETYNFDIFTRGNIEILAAQQSSEGGDWFQGTADAVRSYWKNLRNSDASHFIILAGDHLYRMDYQKFFKTHIESNADVTVAVRPMPLSVADQLGVVKTDDEDRIVKFVEKPQTREEIKELIDPNTGSNQILSSMGIYIFRKEILETALKFDGNDFGKNIIPASIKQFRTTAYKFDEYWEDIGTMDAFFKANIELTEKQSLFTFYNPKHPIYTRPRFLPGSHFRDAKIDKSIITDGVRIGKATILKSVLGLRSIVQDDVYMEETYMMGADFYENNGDIPLGVGSGCRLKKVILDKNVRIGKNVILENREGLQNKKGDLYCIRDGIIVIPKGTIIPDNTII